jgi:NAD-dependent DNA ligase
MDELVRAFTDTSLLKLMVASNLFGVGIGERRLRAIESAGISMTQLISLPEKQVTRKLLAIDGFGDNTVEVVLEGIKPFNKFLKQALRFITVSDKKPVAKKKVVGKLSGQKVTWTGYRSAEEEAAVEAAGGEVVGFSSQTTILLFKAGGKESSKLDKAREKGIRVCTFKELKI